MWTTKPAELEAFCGKWGKKGSEYDVYFGICKRSGGDSGRKDDVLGSTCLWADVDTAVNGWNEETVLRLIGTMPQNLVPSAVVRSGGGLHLYWLLDAPMQFDREDRAWRVDQIEQANIVVRDVFGGDAVQDVSRIMRMPDTYNCKRSKLCKVEYLAPHLTYDLDELIDGLLTFDKVLDGDRWSPRKKVEAKEAMLAKLDPLHRFADAIGGRSVGALHKMWEERVREHAPRGYIGVHEGIVLSTARLGCSQGFKTEEDVVNRVCELIQKHGQFDSSGWDWDAERIKIAHAYQTWLPKWKEIKRREREQKKADG